MKWKAKDQNILLIMPKNRHFYLLGNTKLSAFSREISKHVGNWPFLFFSDFLLTRSWGPFWM